jgi:hypothetical protein
MARRLRIPADLLIRVALCRLLNADDVRGLCGRHIVRAEAQIVALGHHPTQRRLTAALAAPFEEARKAFRDAVRETKATAA